MKIGSDFLWTLEFLPFLNFCENIPCIDIEIVELLDDI